MRQTAPIALAAAVVLLTGACSAHHHPAPSPTASATINATAAAYLADLTAVDPRLAVYPKGAVDNAANTCGEIAAGQLTAGQLRSRIAARFATGSNNNWAMPDDTAGRVLAIIRRHYCPLTRPSASR